LSGALSQEEKSCIILTNGIDIIKTVSSLLTRRKNKLECLTLDFLDESDGVGSLPAMLAIVILSLKILEVTSTSLHCCAIYDKNVFIRLTPGTNVIKEAYPRVEHLKGASPG
jgi:hypothetical protein